ncbi:hypothetical protein TNIN_344511 [Trichonephila inaurata madagascariensis]|uniref:Uncharacterized protein n=1 Tax=Trichonephila inaurata madagascariensis TaxID=2747483 RepID=A0A8X7BP52_9ARAC|nr:hypothetical protein TNIN_344511 [Trichonephila inaurata madagascariensis]
MTPSAVLVLRLKGEKSQVVPAADCVELPPQLCRPRAPTLRIPRDQRDVARMRLPALLQIVPPFPSSFF